MKNTHIFKTDSVTVIWEKEKCFHGRKCLKNIPYLIEKPGVYSFKVSEAQMEIILEKAGICPSAALQVIK